MSATKAMRSFGDVVLGRYAAKAAADSAAFDAVTKAKTLRALRGRSFLGPEWVHSSRYRAGKKLESIAKAEKDLRRQAIEDIAIEGGRALSQSSAFQSAYNPIKFDPRRLAGGAALGAAAGLAARKRGQ